jgi:hypothetical protein
VRDPTVRTEEQREDALKKASQLLKWLTIDISRLTGLPEHDPKYDSKSDFYDDVEIIAGILDDPRADTLLGAQARYIREWAIPTLRRGRPGLRPKRGRRANPLRDRWIAEVVTRISSEYGFSPTRNDATEGTSASLIVSQALAKIGIRLSEQRVARIWGEHRR